MDFSINFGSIINNDKINQYLFQNPDFEFKEDTKLALNIFIDDDKNVFKNCSSFVTYKNNFTIRYE